MEYEKQSLEQVKKAKGNLISLTVKDADKVKGGAKVAKEMSIKR